MIGHKDRPGDPMQIGIPAPVTPAPVTTATTLASTEYTELQRQVIILNNVINGTRERVDALEVKSPGAANTWTTFTVAAGNTATAAAQATTFNGFVAVRGQVTIPSYATVNSWLTIGTLPASSPRPSQEVRFPAYGYDAANHRLGILRVSTTGLIELGSLSTATVSAPITSISLNSIIYPVA